MTKKESLLNGFWKENPVLVSLLGLCSILAVTDRVQNALGLTLGFTFVLVLSNVIISLIRKIVPNEIRIPIYIVIVATLVTLVEMLMQAFVPSLYNSIGFWISLIVVNCIILGRAEAYASENSVGHSFLDAVGMSVGYGGVIILISFIREFLGSGGLTFWNDNTITIISGSFFNDFFLSQPSAFILLGLVIGIANLINNKLKGVKK